MEHSHAHQTLLQRVGGNVHPRDQFPPEFTMGQMVGKAKTTMERGELFRSHLNKWSQFTLPNEDWTNMKQHFGKAYENLLISGRGVAASGTIANVQ